MALLYAMAHGVMRCHPTQSLKYVTCLLPCNRLIYGPSNRRTLFSLLQSSNILQPLKNVRGLHSVKQTDRGLLRVEGQDSFQFLQGLITNDMQHLEDGAPCMFAMVLNSQGRVLHDIIVFKKSSHEYILECSTSSIDKLYRHLLMFKLRKKVSIQNISNELSCYALYDPSVNVDQLNAALDCYFNTPKPHSSFEKDVSLRLEGGMLVRDPRVQYLGHKLILPAAVNLASVIPNAKESDSRSYTLLRYRLGIAEGPDELPYGDVTALEANADYLHGVSFQKGCYIGQELTARVHHTGVVRKRYMPIIFDSISSTTLTPETNITDSKGKVVGRLRTYADKYGIALMRIAQSLAASDSLSLAGVKIKTFKPGWWPIEMSKEDKSKY